MTTTMNAIELEARYSAHNYAPLPVVLARGEGAHLWDTSGRRYVDMMSAYSAASHGHAHPRILKALAAQARRASRYRRAPITTTGSGRCSKSCASCPGSMRRCR
jgi:ornithine--oxo-acid transaminase